MAALSAVDILHCCSLSSYKPSSPFPYFHLPASSKVSFAFSKASRPGLRPLRTISTDVEKPLSPTSPVVTREEAVMLYEDMVLARRFEEKCAEMYNLNKKFDGIAHYAARDPIMALKKHILEQDLASKSELKAIEEKVDDVVEDAVEFADSSPHPPLNQLLENVFADPKGFGIGPDGKYRCEDPSFAAGTAEV